MKIIKTFFMKKIIYAFTRIQQASSAYCSGVEIPVEMFSDWLTLRPYLAKVVQAKDEEERNSYDYAD